MAERAPIRLGYVIGTYPSPTTTFIDREIRALRGLGADVRVVSIRRPPVPRDPAQRAMAEGVRTVLPAGAGALVRSHAAAFLRYPLRTVRAFATLLREPHPSLRARMRTAGHVALGIHVARLLREGGPVDAVHAHFVDRAAVVAITAARLLDVPASATAHANDIYVDPVILPAKLAAARFVVTCTRYNEAHLRAMPFRGIDPPTIRCIYHGLDLAAYEPPASPPSGPPIVLAVAQLKEKKGLRYLVEACARLADDDVAFRCRIVGDGPLREDLERRVDELGLGARVALLGALPHAEVVAEMARAAMFALPSVLAADGDRDGIPNVIVEAMAMGLPVVSTDHSGIPEAVADGETGLLVPTADAGALADAIGALLADRERAAWMGTAGRRRAEKLFDADSNAGRLLEGFRS